MVGDAAPCPLGEVGEGARAVAELAAHPPHDGSHRTRAALIDLCPDPSQLLVVGHCPSGAGRESTPTRTSSTRPFRTAQITSSCFVLIPSLSRMR